MYPHKLSYLLISLILIASQCDNSDGLLTRQKRRLGLQLLNANAANNYLLQRVRTLMNEEGNLNISGEQKHKIFGRDVKQLEGLAQIFPHTHT
jgi:hypothetical protein